MPIKTHQDELPTLNLTPMIDVVFLLIIFFMAATKFAEVERDIALQLPQVDQANPAQTPPAPRQVVVRADGALLLDGQPRQLEELEAQLRSDRQSQPRLGVVIRGDRSCPYQFVAAALAACQQAGVTDLSVSVEVADAGRTVR